MQGWSFIKRPSDKAMFMGVWGYESNNFDFGQLVVGIRWMHMRTGLETQHPNSNV